jgi:hypothetical protein
MPRYIPEETQESGQYPGKENDPVISVTLTGLHTLRLGARMRGTVCPSLYITLKENDGMIAPKKTF